MASPEVQAAIEVLKRKAATQEEELRGLKRAINSLCASEGLPAAYEITDERAVSVGAAVARRDEYASYNAPSTAARAFLKKRGKEVGAATLEEIYDSLLAGGYDFAEKESEAKGGLRIALAKDLSVAKLPNKTFGLAEWYPKHVVDRRKKIGISSASEQTSEEVDEGDDETGDAPAENGSAAVGPAGRKIKLPRRSFE